MKIVPIVAVGALIALLIGRKYYADQPRQGQRPGGHPMSDATVVLVPGLRGHVEDHWQTRLAASLPGRPHGAAARPDQPGLRARVTLLDQVVEDVAGPVVLVAHSAGVLVTVHWAAQYSPTRVVGALLATPPTLAAELPPEYPSIARAAGPRLAADSRVGRCRSPASSRRAATTRSATRCGCAALAAPWGSRVHDLGAVGHLNPASGFGDWPEAVELIAELRDGASSRSTWDASRPAACRSSSGHDRGPERRRRARRGRRRRRPRRAAPEEQTARRWPGLVAAALGLGGAMLAHQFVPAIGVLTWAVALGMVAGNTGLLPRVAKQALAAVTKRLLRIGIVLLGFAVSFGAIMALGVGTVALVAGTLVVTLVVTTWLGNRMKLGAARSLLIGTGFAICGASAIAAMEDTAGADEEDVAVGIAMVTLFGTVAMVLLPLLAGPLGLSDLQFGIWAGASIHEVGQVVAAAGAGGAAVVAIAVVVKLTRVLLLAPVVATVSVRRRLAGQADRPASGRRSCRCSCSGSSPASPCAAPA